jgi:hypothetical protein
MPLVSKITPVKLTKRVEVGERSRFRVVAVTWGDSWGNQSDYFKSSEQYEAMQLTSTGMVIKHDKKGLTLGGELDANYGQRYKRIQFIPRAMIIKITTLGYIQLPERRR